MASGILPDVEGGILPPGKRRGKLRRGGDIFYAFGFVVDWSAGLEARLHGGKRCPPLLKSRGSRGEDGIFLARFVVVADLSAATGVDWTLGVNSFTHGGARPRFRNNRG